MVPYSVRVYEFGVMKLCALLIAQDVLHSTDVGIWASILMNKAGSIELIAAFLHERKPPMQQ